MNPDTPDQPISDSEMIANLTSCNDTERESAFAEIRDRLKDPNLRDGAVNLLIAAFHPYILERSVASVFRAARATFSAQDVAQLVSIKLTNRLREGKVELRSFPEFKVLIRTMTQRLATDKLRVSPKATRRLHGDEDHEGPPVAATDPNASSLVSAAELERIVRTRLQPDEWAAFRFRVHDELEWEQIAAQMYPTDSVDERRRRSDALRIRLGRALKKVAASLPEYAPFFAREI